MSISAAPETCPKTFSIANHFPPLAKVESTPSFSIHMLSLVYPDLVI
jgi:hypothetical protein